MKIGGVMIFFDCFIDNYTYESFRVDFKKIIPTIEITQNNFLEVLAETVNAVVNRKSVYKTILDQLIIHNNHYIEVAGFHKLNFEQLKNFLDQDITPSIYNRGVSSNMMLLYYFSKNIFENEIVSQLVKYYEEHEKKVKEAQEKQARKANALHDDKIPSIELIELDHFLNDEYTNQDNIDWDSIANRFQCVYDKESQRFNSVKRGLLVFLHTKITLFSELQSKINGYYTLLRGYEKKITAFLEKQKIIAEQLNFFKQENSELKNKYKKTRKELTELTKLISQTKKESDKAKDKQIVELSKENNYLKSRIEKLEQEIEILQEVKEINQTIQENVVVDEKPVIAEITKELPEYQSIVVCGGNWNSKEKENLQKALSTCDIEFIDAEKTLIRIDRIKNADVVVFDASRNAHMYYYKIKQNTQKLYHISKSSSEEVLKLWD